MNDQVHLDLARSARETRVGVFYGIAAYGFWGFVAIYFKAVDHVPPLELLAHRIVWSTILLSLLVIIRGRWNETVAVFRSRRLMSVLLVTTILVGFNWLLFIYSVASGQILQASLGYYINPLINVLLGFVVLRERLNRWQWVSVGLAASGVLVMTMAVGSAPWLALMLACSFGLYGLFRKIAPVPALVGLTFETWLLVPLSVVYLLALEVSGEGALFSGGIEQDLLLALAGVVTATPLLWFTNAARRLPLTTLGFLQYIAPTGQFLLAVLVYDEPFGPARLLAFGLIWAGLLLFSLDAAARSRRARIARLARRPPVTFP
ncbi:MAG: EamA family transporter RarD [Phycisphaerales bacterium]